MADVTFLAVPLEIRNEVYKHLLKKKPLMEYPYSSIRLIGVSKLERGVKDPMDIHPAILSVCKQTAFEATEILYSNPMIFICLFHVASWLDIIGYAD